MNSVIKKITSILKKILKKTKAKQKIKFIKEKWNSLSYKNKIFVSAFGSVLLLLVVTTFGRYAYFEIRDFYLASKNFYFNSDKLGERLSRYQVDNWSGADDYTITFNMDSYANNKKFATSDITYDVEYSCSDNIICNISGDYGRISSTSHTDSFVITVTPNAQFQDGDSVWLEVNATSTAPYSKTLSGRFVIKIGKMGLEHEIVDKVNSPYFDLNITNTLDYYLVKEAFDNHTVNSRIDSNTYLDLSDENKEKCTSALIELTFNPEITILDMTNENYLNAVSTQTTTIDGYNYVNKITFKIEALSSASVRFYKKTPSINYTYPFVNDNSIINVTYR